MSERLKPGEGNTTVLTKESLIDALKSKNVKTNLWTLLCIIGLVVYSDRRVTAWEAMLSKMSRTIENDTWRIEDQTAWNQQAELANTNFFFKSPDAEKIVTDRLKRQARRAHAGETEFPTE